MNSRAFDFLVAAAILTVGYFLMQPAPQVDPAPPVPAPSPAPAPPAPPKPKRPRRPWAMPRCSPVGEPEPMVDLLAMPKELRPANIASKRLGCCVFRSADYVGRFCNIPAVVGMPEWMKAKGIEGGGWPEKVSKLIPEIAADRGLPTPVFVQETGKGTALIERALKTGRPVCITWNGNHMLNCVYLDASQGAIVDNNDPHRVQWYPRATFDRKYNQGGGGWTLAFGAPAPPPPPSGPKQRVVAAEPEKPYRWERALADPSQWKLMRDGRQVGLWSAEKFYWCQPEGLAGPCEPPILPPGFKIGAGVSCNWKRSEATAFLLNGRPATKAEVRAALPDDSQQLHVTVIGSKAEHDAVKPILAPYLATMRVQFAEPSWWAVSAPWGFVAKGKPTIYIQDPSGRTLHRQDTADGLAGVLQKIEGTRRPDPNYQPSQDPDLRKSGGLGGPVPAPALAIGLAGLLVAALPRKEQELNDDAA